MTDVHTDEGLREALTTIADWAGPTTPVPAPGTTVAHPRRLDPPAPPRRLVLVAAATVLLVLAAVLVSTRPEAGEVPAAQGEWSGMSAGPLAARRDPSALWSGTEVIIWGGYDGDGEPLTDGARYDPVADRWSPMAPAPAGVGRLGPSAFVQGRAVYVVHDRDAEARFWDWSLVTYDPLADAWTTLVEADFDQLATDELVPRGPVPTHSPEAMAVIDDRVVVIGWNSHDSTYEWVSVDVGDGTWSAAQPLVASGDLYILEKQVAVDGSRVLFGVRERFERASAAWGYLIDVAAGSSSIVSTPPLDDEVWQADLVSSDGSFFRVGSITTGQGESRRTAHRLQPDGSWTEVAPPPDSPTVDGSRAELVATPVGPILLGGIDPGGGTNGGLRTRGGTAVGATPAIDRWRSLPDPTLDLRREGFAAVWTGREIVVWGGASERRPVSGSYIGPGPGVVLADGARYRIG